MEDEFKVSMRGYDRAQVDARVSELRDELSRARQSNNRNSQELDAMRAEIASLNDQLTRTGKIDAAAIVAEADRVSGASARAAKDAASILNEAQAMSAELFQQAKDEAARIVAEAELAAEKAKSLLKAELDAIRNRFRDEQSQP
ncbi:MAG: DivIVA protein [Actinomycetota bacterium]|jgi:DivIVA domain-containing protein